MAVQNVDERTKLRFEYAWRWFDGHAKQRMTMFYYYLIMVGILANAWAQAYDKKQVAVAVAISLLGIVMSVAAICFDMRNRQMLEAGEDILEKLETEEIYTSAFTDGDGNQMGPFTVDRRLGMREGQKRCLRKSALKHKWWIRPIEGLFALGFALGIVLAASGSHSGAQESTSQDLHTCVLGRHDYPYWLQADAGERSNCGRQSRIGAFFCDRTA